MSYGMLTLKPEEIPVDGLSIRLSNAGDGRGWFALFGVGEVGAEYIGFLTREKYAAHDGWDTIAEGLEAVRKYCTTQGIKMVHVKKIEISVMGFFNEVSP